MRTAKDKMQARKTPKGAQEWCFKHKYNPSKCKDELMLLSNTSKMEAKKVWKECWKEIDPVIPKDQEDREMHVLLGAEHLMCERGYVPPHFVYISECSICGLRPTPYPWLKKIDNCTYCRSSHTQEVKDVLEEIERLK